MENCFILHFSDLHFGKLSLIWDSELEYDFQDFMYSLNELLTKIITEKPIKIVLITGDIGSFGELQKNKLIEDFFKIFSKQEIPILICPGNHDLKRALTKKKRFEDFCNLIKTYKKYLGIYFSEDFEINQSSYYYCSDINCLFFSVNSCVNIESVPVLKKKWCYLLKLFKREILYEKSKLDIGIYSKKLLGNFINEVKSKIENYESSKRFILLHHPISSLEKRPNKKIFLEQNEIYGVFSGHFHNYDYKIDGKLHN